MSINLATPGIELYVTPLDPVAVAQGWQYRLRRVGDVVDKEKLEVAVNGTLFESHSRWRPRMAGGRRNRRLPPNSLGRNGESADKRFGCKAAKSGAVAAVTRMHELQWPSIGSANSCFWPSANMSRRVRWQELANLGAKDGMLLDGGGSSSMAIGKDAAGVSAGVLYGGWRPVATHFGVRARPIRMGK